MITRTNAGNKINKHRRMLIMLGVVVVFLMTISVLPTTQSFSSTSLTSYRLRNLPHQLPKQQVARNTYNHNRQQVFSKVSVSTSSQDRNNDSSCSDATYPKSSSPTRRIRGDNQKDVDKIPNSVSDRSRRVALQSMIVAMGSSAVTASQAIAGVAEVDTVTGELYSPKSEMLSGGSAAARGVTLSTGGNKSQNKRLEPGQAYQTVYETRFLAYLSRFLLNYDPAANAWWVKNGMGDTWDAFETDDEQRFNSMMAKEATFAEFAESVEIGLADYFVGPYGSYSSLAAIKAGITAAQPAKSARPTKETDNPFMLTLNDISGMFRPNEKEKKNIKNQINKRKTGSKTTGQDKNTRIAKDGILNLYTLLKARYQSISAKRQLAILFTFISNPKLQPTAEIRSLLGEVDNATVSQIDVIKPMKSNINEPMSRTSSRRGGGYSIQNPPKVTIDAPPALGTEYQRALIEPVMKPTSRVLKINVVDGGSGYTTPPEVTVSSGSRQCEACAILDREGHVESIIVLDPGFGYGRKSEQPPRVTIASPKKPKNTRSGRGNQQRQRDTVVGDARMTTNSNDEIVSIRRVAKAIAELEYEIVDINVLSGGNGFVATEPPKVRINPPTEDPDWYVEVLSELAPLLTEYGPVRAEVTQMKRPNGNLAYSMGTSIGYNPTMTSPTLRLNTIRMRQEPLELLPSAIRPVYDDDRQFYSIPYLPPPSLSAAKPDGLSPRYREVDPLFGAIGTVPVTKGALELEPSEYGRLALSGALCTVLVRTALNPLELVKTKLQLNNDEELFDYARQKQNVAETAANGMAATAKTEEKREPPLPELLSEREVLQNEGQAAIVNGETSQDEKKEEIGTVDLIKNMIELRGPFSLFQSADITFLASLVFGSFGFGATELFRRSFTMAFFTEPSDDYQAEIILLLAATVATIITSAAAAPFELLRVRSMGLVEQQKWTDVLEDFLAEKNSAADAKRKSEERMEGLDGVTGQRTLQTDLKLSNGVQEVLEREVATLVAAQEEELNATIASSSIDWKQPKTLLPLWAGFAPTASRELAFAIPKFLAFDIIARSFVAIVNSQADPGALPVQVGVGTTGLVISAFAGALAGIAGAVVSHPADLILTYTSASPSKKKGNADDVDSAGSDEDEAGESADWKEVVKDLTSREGGLANLFLGLPPRLTFFFLVIGLQFFLYDYVKNLLQVGSDDLSLVLDVFYAIRQGLLNQ